MKFLLKIVVIGVTVFFLPYIIPGIVVTGWKAALIASIVLGLVNLLIKPIISLFTFPINFLSLGLFGILVNGLLFWGVARFVPGFSVSSFLYALAGAVIVSLVNWIISKI